MITARATPLLSVVVLSAACLFGPGPGYGASNPAEVTCGCHEGAACYEGATSLVARSGENAGTAEELMYFAQCACFQGSLAGCNTLGHFTKDYLKACEQGEDVATSCTIAGFIHHHGVSVPSMSGQSFERDPVRAKVAFERGCRAGSPVACAHTSR